MKETLLKSLVWLAIITVITFIMFKFSQAIYYVAVSEIESRYE